MGARGFNVAQEGHVVPILEPASISGGVAGTAFNLKNAAKCNILLSFGAIAAAEGAIQLFAATDNTGATSLAIPFDLYRAETPGVGNDVLLPRLAVPATGYVPPATANIFYVLHLQADQLPQGYPYLQLKIADGTNADYASAFAILSGLRFGGDGTQNLSVTT